MKKIVFIIMIVVSTLGCTYPVLAKSTEEELLQEQQETFGIASFIENTKKYTGSFFEGVDIDGMFQSALKGKIDNGQIYTRILNLLGTEVQNGIKSLVSILIIVLIHSLLKAISDNLENDTIANIIYYVQYIAIVTVIMTNFSDMIQLVKETSSNLVGVMNSLVPILMALMLYTGSITTSSVLEPIILFMIHFIGNLIQTILIPLTLVAATLSIVSKIGDKVQIDKLAKTFHSGIVLVLGIILTIFVGVVSLEGTLSSSVDGITAKTTKAIVSTSIPVVGKILGDVVDSVLGCGVILKNAVGVIGVVIHRRLHFANFKNWNFNDVL